EHLVVAERDAVGADALADLLHVGVEEPLLVEHLDGHRVSPVAHYDRARRDRVALLRRVARAAPAAADAVAVPAAAAVAVYVVLAEVVVAVDRDLLRRPGIGRVGRRRVVGVLVGLHVGERPRPREAGRGRPGEAGRRALGGVVRDRVVERWAEADGRGADAEL